MPISVFLSSTARDLAPYRAAVRDAIEGMDGYHCVRMETFGARAWSAADFCRKKVGECDLFIGIVGHLHGSSPRASEQSYTELEYEAALDHERPRLMFLAPNNFDVPADLLDEELEKSPQKRTRQKTFRVRVSADLICDGFTTPEDLAGRVRQAIHNWEQDQKQEEQTPNLGHFVPQTCDRTDQEADFRRHFSSGLSRHPGFPQFYLIHGGERESHGSLVERFRATRVQEHANLKWGEQKATVSLWDLDWPDMDNLESRREYLKALLFEKLDPYSPVKENYDYSATALRTLLTATLNSIIIIQHEISATSCDKTTAQLIEWYLRFWDEVKSTAAIPQCLIFLNLLYPHMPEGRAWAFWQSLPRFFQNRRNRRIQRELKYLCRTRGEAVPEGERRPSHCPCVILGELSCVKPEDVMRWLRRHKIGNDDGEREQRCHEIFMAEGKKLSACKNMRDVEHALNKIHQRVVKRRVGL